MSISHTSQEHQPRSDFHLAWLAKLAGVFGARRRRNSRFDPVHLPQDLQRDIGLLDGRGRNGDLGRDSAWRAAMLTYPPRTL